MDFSGPTIGSVLKKLITPLTSGMKEQAQALHPFPKDKNKKRTFYATAALIDALLIVLMLSIGVKQTQNMISPFSHIQSLDQSQQKGNYEVFGFAPYWTFENLDNVDFKTLTTLAYFDLPINTDGSLNQSSPGYKTFHSNEATQLFKNAHANGTKVVATFTMMNQAGIRKFLDNPKAQEQAITTAVQLVKERGIDGANLDIEYISNPGEEYRRKYSQFVQTFSNRMHQEVPNSQVTVSVIASSALEGKLYDLASLSTSTDKIFMMAYDFAVNGSANAMPTAPLYGAETGQYWYDVSTAVSDFLEKMPAEKLIVGLPWYGYNYAVYEPEVNAQTHKGFVSYKKKGKKTIKIVTVPQSRSQTYSIIEDTINEATPGYKVGWDDLGKVGYKAYYSTQDKTWRMIFGEDTKSLGYKYQFIKDNKLAGVGMWALGFDEGKHELWEQLAEYFGTKEVAMDAIPARSQ